MKALRQPPHNCPVCGEDLSVTRLSCDECGTELTGHFPMSPFSALSQEDAQTLRVFLSSRGNMKELERHLNVSYPTARARFEGILSKIGIEPVGEASDPQETEEDPSIDVLDSLAKGDIDVDEALKRLG